jgi:hypothetical protein
MDNFNDMLEKEEIE